MWATISPKLLARQLSENPQLQQPWKFLQKRRKKEAKLDKIPLTSVQEREFIPGLLKARGLIGLIQTRHLLARHDGRTSSQPPYDRAHITCSQSSARKSTLTHPPTHMLHHIRTADHIRFHTICSK